MSRETEIRRGREALAQGDAAAAERALSAAIDGGSAVPEALKARATARARLLNWSGAADYLERLIMSAPDESSPVELEYVRVLRLASERGGTLTVAQTAMDLDVSLDAAEAALDECSRKGGAYIDTDPKTGIPSYRFPEFQAADARSGPK